MSRRSERPRRILDKVKKLIGTGREIEGACTHLDQIQDVTPSAEGCEACLAIGDTWVHLRLCMSCGQVGCCNDSVNQHAWKHFQATGHPVMRSFEPNETWMWCYIDERLISN